MSFTARRFSVFARNRDFREWIILQRVGREVFLMGHHSNSSSLIVNLLLRHYP